MARLQILDLPEGSNDDQPPFVLVVDEYQPQRYILGLGDDHPQPVGLFEGVAEKIGARCVLVFEETIDIPANDTTAYLQQVAEEAGATIGKITSAFNAQQLADERADMDRLAKWKNELLDALGMDRTRDWDDIRNAARGLRKDCDSRAAPTEKIRQIHSKHLQDDRYEYTGVCNSDGEDWPCRTIQALNGQSTADA